MNTKYFNDDMQQLDPKNINAIHMPVLFLLDTSIPWMENLSENFRKA